MAFGGAGISGQARKPPVYREEAVRFNVGGWSMDGSRGETVARFEAEVERFLKKGILERSLLGADGGVEDGEEYVLEDDVYDVDESSVVSDSDGDAVPVGRMISSSALDNFGPSPFVMSPKNRSVSLTASLCSTPAKATTILSGL